MTIADELFEYNSKKYNIRKCAEEASELATVLLQLLNKWDSPDKRPTIQEIVDEIGDLEIRLPVLRKIFGNQLVNERIRHKTANYSKYMKQKLYKNV